MGKVENLGKENLWNELHDKFPDAVDHFCKWIDKYKKEVNWNVLFNESDNGAPAPKFHDLPFEMQTGILARYELECFYAGEKSQYKDYVETYKKALINAFSNRPKDKLKT